MTDTLKCNGAYSHFIGSVATEDDGGWSKEVWDAAWQVQQKDIDSLHARVKMLEEECAWLNSVGKPNEKI